MSKMSLTDTDALLLQNSIIQHSALYLFLFCFTLNIEMICFVGGLLIPLASFASNTGRLSAPRSPSHSLHSRSRSSLGLSRTSSHECQHLRLTSLFLLMMGMTKYKRRHTDTGIKGSVGPAVLVSHWLGELLVRITVIYTKIRVSWHFIPFFSRHRFICGLRDRVHHRETKISWGGAGCVQEEAEDCSRVLASC